MKPAPDKIKIVAQYEKRGIRAFLNFLKREQIFDISDGNVKNWKKFSEAYVQVGQSAEVSDQGNKLTCASHAMGKVLVEILNNFTLDCDQKKIIDDLIKNVQPNEEAVPIHKFNFKKFDLEFWDWDINLGKGSLKTRTEGPLNLPQIFLPNPLFLLLNPPSF